MASWLLSYSPDNLDKDLDAAKSHLTGDFLTYYTQFTDQVVRPAVKTKKVSTSANVVQAAVGEDEIRAEAEAFVVDHLDELLARMPDEWGASLVGSLVTSCDAARIEPMRAAAEAKLAGRRGARRRIDQAFERFGQCVAQRAVAAPAIARWLTQLH